MVRSFLSAVVAAALCLAPEFAQAQERFVAGRVTVAGTQEPLGDATVALLGQQGGVRSNERGEFRIRVPSGEVVLVARAIGYKRVTVRVPAGGQSVAIAMDKDVLQLEGVTVTGQATVTDRSVAPNAVTQVNAEDLSRVPAPSLESQLQGKVVGAAINMNSGAPGGGGQIQIRGASSIIGNSDPLYVMDGVVISNAAISTGLNSVTRAGGAAISSSQDDPANRLADINPNEIETIEVLKGAAATAIYGARASNGVVIITTKRGKAGAPRFSVLQRVGTQSILKNIGTRRYTSLDQALGSAYTGRDSTTIRGLFANGTPRHHDFIDELYDEKEPSYETVITTSGGGDRNRYYVSAAQKVEKGLQPSTGGRLQSLRLNLDQDIGSKTTAVVSLSVSRNKLQRGISNNDNSCVSPIYCFAYTPGIIDLARRDSLGNFIQNPFNGGGAASSNPFQTLAYLQNEDDVTRQIGALSATYQLFTGARVQAQVTGRFNFDRFDSEAKLYSPNFLQFEGNDGQLGTAVQSSSASRQVNSSANLNLSYTPGNAWFTSTTTGSLIYVESDLNVYRLRATGLVPTQENADRGAINIPLQTRTEFRDQGFDINQQFTLLQERLLVTGGVRGDRGSANGDREKFFTYPRVGGSFVFTAPFATVDRFKLRAAYGETGNRPNFGVRDVTVSTTGQIGGNNAIGAAGALGNPNIEPERNREIEGGFDASFLGDRVGLEFTAFNRVIDNLLLNAPLAPSSGVGSQIINGGELNTKGFEALLALVPVRNFRGIQWTSRTTFQTYDQKVKDLPSVVPRFPVLGSFGASFGRNYINEGTSATAIWGNKPVMIDGALVTRDTIIGDANPDFRMGFANNFTFSRFAISTLLDWKKGGDVVNMTALLYDEGENSADFDKPLSDEQRAKCGCNNKLGVYRYSQWAGGTNAGVYVEDGGFVKLREVTLSYDVPASVVRRVGTRFDALRLSLSGRNLAMWTDYSGFDPEFNNFGNTNFNRFIDLAPFPASRQYFFSVELGF